MNNVYAEVITIGDEILYGQTLDTNTHWMGQKLNELGIKIIRKVSIGDDKEEIVSALDEASRRADIILMTGGLGPTKDDITKFTLAAYFGMPLRRNEEALAHITELFASRGRTITPTNEKQADLPLGCTIITNRMGTAPAMWFEREGKVFVSMPGVPYEMKTIMEEEVLPRLKENFSLPVIYHQMIQTVGIGESWLSDKIEAWETSLPSHIRLAYLPSFGNVKLRLTALGDDLELLKAQVMEEVDKVMPLIEEYVFALGDISLEETIGNMLMEKGKTIALAESCSGGYVAHSLTSTAGSSAYFQGALVPYHNKLKEEVLDVKKETLINNGAVSEATVTEMAQNIRKLLQADFGLASSGIAGPGGGTLEKPVGTIWIAVADAHETITQKLTLSKDRMLNIKLTKVALLNLLRKRLKQLA
ncbi:competence/damage-inducible protein A [Catalinimonas niigatensis]|uniref:competence/damage-inducible protein A n=1 Tax=Catalinimonas niigatensis TaxID=1397264 RepID=UPI002666AA9A|nr:competence/damage-inducible protein A [Catalinimonas niigatensis]WPP51308.1 competence/damage-inducible protein A [Catalinimonas niigatensis]